MAAVAAGAAQRGARTLRLHTGSRQAPAPILYTALGYRPVVLWPRHRDDPLAMCLAKPLGPAAPE